MSTTRRLAAILAADVTGFSALMERDEEGTFARIGKLRREVIEPELAGHQGRLIKTTGDGFLAEFASPIAALRCALAIQSNLTSDPGALRLRIGLNLGDVIVEESGDIYGEGVNIAARLEALAEPGGILISGKIYGEVEGKVEAAYEDRGEQPVKNIARPVRIYSVRPVGTSTAKLSAPDAAQPLALPDKPSIAVLPFQNMSGDPEQEYFADGMVEDIITALSRARWFFVIARNSSFTYKGKAVDIKQIGRELGVRYVLEGSVRKVGERVRITGQLIEAATGSHLWADKFDGALEDIFDLQDQVTTSVVGAIYPQLEHAEIERAKRKPTESLQAYDYYMRALACLHKNSREAHLEALTLCQIANDADPEFALSYALGAHLYNHRKSFGWSADATEEISETRRLARRAVELDQHDPTVLTFAGFALGYVADEVEEGIGLISRAIILDPNLALARTAAGLTNLWLGNVDAAIEQFHVALRLSPLDKRFSAPNGMAIAHFLAGRYEEASSWATIATQRQPNFAIAQRTAMACYAMSGRVKEAQRTCEVALLLDPTMRISELRKSLPYRRPEDLQKLADAYRIAGMPE